VTSAASQAWAVLRKDLLIELRTREILYSMGLFSVLVTMIFTFAFYVREEALALVSPGIPWVALTFAGTLGLARSWAREGEEDCLGALIGAPAPRGAIFLGKMAANGVFVSLTAAFLVPLSMGMFILDLSPAPGLAIALFALGLLGFVAVGTVFGGMLLNSRLRDVLLPLVFYPIVAPVVLAGVKGTAAVVGNDLVAAQEWLMLLASFDGIFVTASFWAFGWVIAE
jgi:heme exporter protein B